MLGNGAQASGEKTLDVRDDGPFILKSGMPVGDPSSPGGDMGAEDPNIVSPYSDYAYADGMIVMPGQESVTLLENLEQPDYDDSLLPEIEKVYGDDLIVSEDDDEAFTIAKSGKTILILHGWDAFNSKTPGKALYPFINSLRAHYHPKGVRVLFKEYDTSKSFVRGAAQMARYIKECNVDTSQLHIFAYSMGGLVARQMIANGMRPRCLFTYCTPHLGTMPGIQWVWPNQGSQSMFPLSADLGRLNKNARDIAYRKYVTAIGFMYFAPQPEMQDGLVGLHSATGTGLGFGASRAWKALAFGPQMPLNPHGYLQEFPHIKPAMQLFVKTVG